MNSRWNQAELQEEQQVSEEVLLKAGHYLWCGVFAETVEDLGVNRDFYGPGAKLADVLPEADPRKLLPIMRVYETQLARMLDNTSLKTVFEIMDLDDERQATFIYHLLHACSGGGLSVYDGEFDEELDRYSEATEMAFSAAPYRNDLHELNDLVDNWLMNEGYSIDNSEVYEKSY